MEKLLYKDIVALYQEARTENFAIPAFNYSDLWDLKAIVGAAVEERSPVLVMVDLPVAEGLGMELCAAMVDVLAKQAPVPVIHHLDHCTDPRLCRTAIELGWKSVMLDASHKPLEENINRVRKITGFAHPRGCFVEAEIGRIRGESGYESSYQGDDYLFRLDEALALVEQAKPDSLAIGIGNAHGFYQGEPRLHYEKLREADEAIDVPLVLHGGTGIPAKDIQKLVRGGIRKVNVGTAVFTTYMNSLREQLIAGGENQFTLDVMEPAVQRTKDVVREWIRACNASGRA